MRINFATAEDIAGFARHAVWVIFAHPLEVVRVVTASFKLAGVPRPKAFALRAEHLIAAIGFVNGNLAIGARFSRGFEKRDRSDGVGIANMKRIVASGLEFPAMRACVFLARSTLPSGRDEAVACGIGAVMNELINGCIGGRCPPLALQHMFCLQQINFECLKSLDLLRDILNLGINVGDEEVMRDGGLCCRKHGLFLSEENILLVLSEVALEKELGESEVLKLRMSEVSVAEDALGNSDIIAAEEGLIACSACGFSARRAPDLFAIGSIEVVGTDVAGHIL